MSNSCTEELPDRFLALDPRNKFVIREIYARLRESRRACLVRRPSHLRRLVRANGAALNRHIKSLDHSPGGRRGELAR